MLPRSLREALGCSGGFNHCKSQIAQTQAALLRIFRARQAQECSLQMGQ